MEIDQQLADAGYRMLGANKEQLILNILKLKNTRYLRAIPSLIYNYDLNIELIYAKTNKRDIFSQILKFTLRIFQENNITKKLPLFNETAKLDYNEFKEEFELQIKAKPTLMVDKQKIYAERNLHMWLSQIFTRKEKYIIDRVLKDKAVSKTDYEYYSRKTKKKLKSIIGLEDFALNLLTKDVKFDENLFILKKKLEQWFVDNEGIKDISILKYFIWDHDKIMVNYKRLILDQRYNSTLALKKIKDKDVLNLLKIYPEGDFS